MRDKIILALAVTAVVAGLFAFTPKPTQDSHSLITREEISLLSLFTSWTEKYHKAYISEENRAFRFKRFSDNFVFVKEHNARYNKGLEIYDLEMNAFADLDVEEYKALYLGLKAKSITKKCYGQVKPVPNPPSEVNWGEKGAVTPVRNQGSCGSCWAFSTIGSLEGLAAIEKGTLLSLSVQQLVDCAKKEYGNEGCNGGDMDSAMWYVIDNGITSEARYPYKGKDQPCTYNSTMKVYQISDCAEVPANKTSSLVSAVVAQPVSISVDAGQSGFQLYRSGVFNGKCGHEMDHGVYNF